MKKYPRKPVIIFSYWTIIMILIWFGNDIDMPFVERLLSFLSFAGVSGLISLSFSKTLFNKTVTTGKPFPFVLKFVGLTICLLVSYGLLSSAFYFLEVNQVFRSAYFIEGRQSFFQNLEDGLAGLISANLLFCGILLYYEYSELRNMNLKYHLQILHAQINPHFMFNVLNHIYILMQKDVDKASTLLLKYSDTLRYQLYSGKKGMVTLDKEVHFLKDYIDVEKFRWEGKLDVTTSWDIENSNKEIPPLLLVTFVENAFKHVSRSGKDKGYIDIELVQKGNQLYLKVENSKSEVSGKKDKDSGIGLENAKTRLNILYPKNHSLQIENNKTDYRIILSVNI